MIGLQTLYTLAGLFFAVISVLGIVDKHTPKRFNNALFWGMNAVILIAGNDLGAFTTGCLVLASVAIASIGGLGVSRRAGNSQQERHQNAQCYGNRLFIPALLIPLVTFVGTLTLDHITVGGRPLVSAGNSTLVAMVLGAVVALVVGLVMLKQTPLKPMDESRKILDTVGWASVLPQMLAALGGIFATAGVGHIVSQLILTIVPLNLPIIIITAYCLGMALFTMIMGNAFAAFPVMTAGIGLPLIVNDFHGNAAIMSSMGMLAGFCGTLMTPMAANFNIVPAMLLELPDKYSVIKAQLPTALILLFAITCLMNLLVLHF